MYGITRSAAMLAFALMALAFFVMPHEAHAQGIVAWSPPAMSSPTTVNIDSNGNCSPNICTRPGNGYTQVNMTSTKDYVIHLPASKKTGGLGIQGGRNVKVIGGYISANPDHITDNTDYRKASVTISANYGVVHLEGLKIDDSAGGQSDGIQISGDPNGSVQVENVWEQVFGGLDTDASWVHSDVIQLLSQTTAPAVQELRVDRLTGASSVNGFQFEKWGPTKIKRVNLKGNPNHTTNALGVLVRLNTGGTNGGTCESSTHRFQSVYAEPRDGRALGMDVGPRSNHPSCPAVESQNPYKVTWPALNLINDTGTGGLYDGYVYAGPPSTGDYVSPANVGIGYVPYGYF